MVVVDSTFAPTVSFRSFNNDWLVYLGERGELISIGNYYGMELQCIIHKTYQQADIGGLANFAVSTALAVSSADRKDWMG